MKLMTQTCDPHRLEAFFQGDLNATEEADLAVHLNDCGACRQQLEASAAEPACWSKAGELLQPNEFGDEDAAARPQRPLQIQNVLDTLAPTDDPGMLGRLGGYEVSGIVGTGGMGVVLKGFDGSLDRTVAIKVLAPHLASSGAARKRFAREAKAAAAVLHPNVMAIHSVSNDESLPYLVMPYVRGASLQKRIDSEGPLSVREVLRIGSQIAAGLAAAHAQGLVHRDIKPANILLEEGVERVAITDFGLARAVDDATMTRTGVIAGTPQYMSPEQARGESIDQRSDLFSLGSVLYAMCTGRPPFRAETSYGVLRRISDAEPRPIREINPDVPEWLCRIISKLMSKQADDRFESAGQIAQLLEECLAHVQQPATVPLPESCLSLRQSSTLDQPDRAIGRFARKPWSSAQRLVSRRSIGVITMVSVLGFGLLGMFLWQSAAPPDISGHWAGEGWGQVELEEQQPGQYAGTYTDTFGDEAGKLQLKWSRIERRFNGTWQEGMDRYGKISVRLVDDEIRGAWTTNKNSGINPGTPRLADLLWTRAAKTLRGKTQIRVLGADGKPVADNAVILGTEGYPGQFLPRMSEAPSHRGVTSLERLAADTHWFLVRDNNSVLRIELPDEKQDGPPIYTGLPKYPNLIGKNVNVKVAIEVENDVEFIVIEIHNRSEEHLLVTEANLQLFTAINSREGDARVMSPKWSKVTAGKAIPETTIQPDQTATLRLNWNDWVKNGYWFSRDGEHITEPHFRFPVGELGTTWVRVMLGSAPPVMVTHPDRIVADGRDVPVPAAPLNLRHEQAALRNQELRTARDVREVETLLKLKATLTRERDWPGYLDLLTNDEVDRLAGVILHQMTVVKTLLQHGVDIKTGGTYLAMNWSTNVIQRSRLADPPEDALKAYQRLVETTLAHRLRPGDLETPETYSRLLSTSAGILMDKRQFLVDMWTASDAEIGLKESGESAPNWNVTVEGDRAFATDSAALRSPVQLARIDGHWKISSLYSDDVIMRMVAGEMFVRGDRQSDPPNEAPANPEDKRVSLGIPDAKKLTGRWLGEKDGMTVELTFTTEKEWRMLVSTGRFTIKTDPLVWEVDDETRSISLLKEFRHVGGIRDGTPGWDKFGELQDGEGDTLRVKLLPRPYQQWYKYRPVNGLVLERVAPTPRKTISSGQDDAPKRVPQSSEDSHWLEFRLAYYEPAEGLVEASGGGQRVYGEKRSLATIQDVAAVRLVDDASGKPAIEITFRPECAVRVRELTARHIDKPLAVMLGGRLLTAPTIREPFRDKAVITGKFTPEEAERIRATIALLVKADTVEGKDHAKCTNTCP